MRTETSLLAGDTPPNEYLLAVSTVLAQAGAIRAGGIDGPRDANLQAIVSEISLAQGVELSVAVGRAGEVVLSGARFVNPPASIAVRAFDPDGTPTWLALEDLDDERTTSGRLRSTRPITRKADRVPSSQHLARSMTG